MRPALRLCLLPLAGLVFTGCVEKESVDPGAFIREETVRRVGPSTMTSSRTVRCGCDADGDLHIVAPQGSRVTVPENATRPAEAEIELADDRPPAPLPLRTTKSLGFIGDGKLSQGPSRGGPWNVPDALLPPHRHVEPHYGGYGGYGGYRGVRSYGSRIPFGYGTTWNGGVTSAPSGNRGSGTWSSPGVSSPSSPGGVHRACRASLAGGADARSIAL